MTNSAAAEINATFSILLLASSIATGLYHLVSVRAHNRSKDANATGAATDPSLLTSHLLIGVAIVSGVSLTLDSALTSKLCRYAQYYGPSLYSLFQTLVYLVPCLRIWMRISSARGVAATMYAYNKRALLCWGAFLVLWTTLNVIAGNLTVTHTLETDSECIVTPSTMYIASQVCVFFCETGLHRFTRPYRLVQSSSIQLNLSSVISKKKALLDLVSGAVNCALFVAPLCKLSKVKENAALKASAYKQCILSVVCIASSIASMAGIGAATDYVPLWVAMDMMVSTVCVVLMFEWNAHIAARLFCCCLPQAEAQVSRSVSKKVPPTSPGSGKVEVEVVHKESAATEAQV